MRLKIFSCHHEPPAYIIATPLFQTLVSGVPAEQADGALSDRQGENIARREKFCELRHQYFVWRNLLGQLDYVGFEHYRRLFYIDPYPLEDRFNPLAQARLEFARNPHQDAKIMEPAGAFQPLLARRRALDDAMQARIKNWVASYDILYTMPIDMPVDQNFKLCSPSAGLYWDEMAARFRAAGSPLSRLLMPPAAWSGHLNMYLMRAELFDSFMAAIFPILLALDDAFPAAPARIWGFLAERLLGPFIMQTAMEQPMLRFGILPHLVFSKDEVQK